MPNRVSTVALSEGDQTWLASTHGIHKNPQGKLKLASFTVEDEYIPSGTPLAITGEGGLAEELVPYDAAGTGEVTVLAGFLRNDIPVTPGSPDTHANVAFIDHGRVRIGRLPVEFDVPAKANDNTTITYVTN